MIHLCPKLKTPVHIHIKSVDHAEYKFEIIGMHSFLLGHQLFRPMFAPAVITMSYSFVFPGLFFKLILIDHPQPNHRPIVSIYKAEHPKPN